MAAVADKGDGLTDTEIVIGRGFRLFNGSACFRCGSKGKADPSTTNGAAGGVDITDEHSAEDQRLYSTTGGGTAGKEEDVVFRRHRFDVNMYATKKSAANGLMDLALLMANASQLKHILLNGTEHRFYYIMLSLLLSSIFLQIGIGIALLYLARQKVKEDIENQDDKNSALQADVLNNWVVAFIFILTVINVFISAFGLNQAKAPVVP